MDVQREAPQDIQPESFPNESAFKSNKLFLGGLSWSTNEETLKSYFSTYGEVEDVVVMRDKLTKKPRGFGFITFKEDSVAQFACQATHTIDGRQIDAKRSVPRQEKQVPKSKKIFVGGLSPETNEDSFRHYFEMFGAITDATIMVDHSNGRSRGFGFITFENELSPLGVFRNGRMHTVNNKQVEVKSATPRGISAPPPPPYGRPYPGGYPGHGGYGNRDGGYVHGGFQGQHFGAYGQGYPGPYGNYAYGGNVNQGYGGYNVVGYGGYGGQQPPPPPQHTQGYGGGSPGNMYGAPSAQQHQPQPRQPYGNSHGPHAPPSDNRHYYHQGHGGRGGGGGPYGGPRPAPPRAGQQ